MSVLPSQHALTPRALRVVTVCLLVAISAPVASAQSPAQAAVASLSSTAPRPFSRWSASVHAFRDSLVALAKAQVGTRYVRGGQSPERGFDCSGLVRYVMAGLHVGLPRTAAQQASTGFAVERDADHLRPGDLLTFGKGKRGVSHIGIYIGNGRYVHASSIAGRVIESDLDRPASPLIKNWRGVRRLVIADSLQQKRDDS